MDMAEYRKMAKRADTRLRALEKLSGEENFAGIKQFAYKRAMRDIRSWGGSDRFGTSVKGLTEKQIEMKFADIEKFLDAPTSTKTGTVDIYQRRADTLNNRLNLKGDEKISWQEWAAFWESDSYKKMKSYFEGSSTLVNMVAQFARQRDEIKKAVEENDFQHIQISPEFVRSTAIEYLEADGIDFAKLFGGDE